MNLLERIQSFGAIDAENDTNLLEYFYQTPVLEKLFAYNKSVVIGRKGTGKTALYRYIENHKGNTAVPLVFRDYPWQAHDRFKNHAVSERESYFNAWQFFFYIEIFKKITMLHSELSKEGRKQSRKLRRWLKKNWGTVDFDHREVLQPKARTLKWTFQPQVFGNSLGALTPSASENADLGATLTEFNRKFDRLLPSLLQHYSAEVTLLFDELDLSYQQGDREYQHRLVGLLLAAYHFFQKYREKIRVYIFLRNDIFSALEFQDKNKIKDNMVEFLDWDAQNIDSRLSLKSVISNRIAVNIESKSDNFERNWSEVFEDSKIGKNQFKWNFIVDRSFIRPRDIIKFMNLAVEQAQSRLRNDPNGIDRITNDDIHAIRSQYSTYLFEELRDEISTRYPDFEQYFEVLRDIHHVTFTPEKYDESYATVATRFELHASRDQVLERLYEFSVIGFYKPGGGGFGGSEYRFQYTSDYQPFNPQARLFKVQPGFKEHLELVE